MKKQTVTLILAILLANVYQSNAQINYFNWTTNDTTTTTLNPFDTTSVVLQMNMGNLLQDTLKAGVEIIYNDIPASWQGKVCIYGKCLMVIPLVGYNDQMDDISPNQTGYVRLTIRTNGNVGQAKLRIRVFDIADPSKSDTATWLLNTGPVAVKDLHLNQTISVFPNPATNMIQIQLKDDAQKIEAIRILNFYGQQISSINSFSNSSNIYSLNTTTLSAGQYLLDIRSDKGRVIKKLIKQ